MIYIYHHLGLGDHIICNGLVRHFAEKDEVSIPCKPWNYASVKAMYSDDPKITVIKVKGDPEAEILLEGYKAVGIPTMQVTWNWGVGKQTNIEFDEWFYVGYDLPFEYRWSKCRIPRFPELEDKLFTTLNPTNERYAFVHDDPSRSQYIDSSKINTNLRIIKPVPGLVDNIFAYYSLIEKAEEVHALNSCFALFTDSVFNKENCYVHMYARKDSPAHYKSFKTVR